MITTSNYYQEIKSVDISSLPNTLQEGHEFLDKLTQNGRSFKDYENDKDLKEIVDLYLKKLNAHLQKGKSEPKPATVKAKKKVVEKKITDKPKPAGRAKATSNVVPVRKRAIALDYIRRYANFHGKKVTAKQTNSLLSAIQAANFEAKFKVYDPNIEVIAHIQSQLVKLSKIADGSTTVLIEHVERYKELGNSEVQMKSVQLLKRWARLNGSNNVAAINKLAEELKKAVDTGKISPKDKYFNLINQIRIELIGAGKSGKLEPTEITLGSVKGLGIWPLIATYFTTKAVDKVLSSSADAIKKEVAGTSKKKSSSQKTDGLGCTDLVCTCPKPMQGLGSVSTFPVLSQPTTVNTFVDRPLMPSPITVESPMFNPGRMSVNQAIASKFELLNLDGEWLNLIGEACMPTSFFIYGPGGSGKSTFTLKFANYMASRGNKVLYVAGEQFGTPVFAKMLQRLNIVDSHRFVIVKDLNVESPEGFDIVVLDSKDSLEVELQDYLTLQKKYPKQSYIILSQATKDGNFTGSEKWRNVVDTMIVCEKGVAYTNRDKNRWGGSGELQIY